MVYIFKLCMHGGIFDALFSHEVQWFLLCTIEVSDLPNYASQREHNFSSGVGTVVAVAALATTLFRPCINVHNLHDKLALASLVLSKVKQHLHCISLICSCMCTFPIKVYYKVMEILPVSWLGTKLMQIFKTTKQAMKASREQWQSQYNVFHINWILY